MAILRSNGLLIVDSIPTHTPVNGEATVARLLNTGIFYYWNSSTWITTGLGGTTGQGITAGTTINLGDSTASTAAAGKLTSNRFINQDGNDVSFVGEHDSEVSTVTINSESSIILRNANAIAGDTSELILNANHNASTGGVTPFLQFYPGDTNVPANNLVVPYLTHMYSGADATGFNEAPQSTYVYAFGININRPGAAPYESSRGGIGVAMEHYFDAMDDTTGRQEMHLIHNLPGGLSDGSGGRLFTYQGFENELLGSSAAFQTGRDDVSQESFSLRTQEGVARVTFDWGTKFINLYNSMGFYGRVNNVPILRQTNAIGNSAINLIYANADDNVVVNSNFIFDSSGTAIRSVSGVIGFGTEANGATDGQYNVSSGTSLLRLKQAGVSGIFNINRDATQWFFGTWGNNPFIKIHTAAPESSIHIGSSGAVGINGASNTYKFGVNVTGNNGIQINNSGNTGGDFSVLDFSQGGASKAVIYTNSDNLTISAPVGNIVLNPLNYLISILPTFADNTAAAALPTNTFYKTATGEVRQKV